MKALVVGLLTWISAHTTYPMPAETPVIAVVPHAYLELLACGQSCEALGVYPDAGVIYVDAKLQLDSNICARSVLLHELVHYDQQQEGRFLNLPRVIQSQLREREAYSVQKQFLSDNGRAVDFGNNFRLGAFMGPACNPGQRAGG
jgi:hypothetical protein